jgi:transglutaminase 1
MENLKKNLDFPPCIAKFMNHSILFIFLTDSPSTELLTINKVDLNATRNGKTHHTDRFDLMKREIPKLVIRRGQPFKLQLHCNRPYNAEKDAISLVFAVADVDKPSFGHGTLIAVALKNKATDLGRSFEWGASVNAINGNILEILIKPAANALVTQWKLDIDSKVLNGTTSKSYSLPQPFYVLFNPWCREDQVYLEGETAMSAVIKNFN